MAFRERVKVSDGVHLRRRPHRRGGAPPIDPRPDSNMSITLREEPNGRIVEKRDVHNIFLDYGREWLAELTGLDAVDTPFRNDRLNYMAVGIGGASQIVGGAEMRLATGSGGYGYAGFANDWGYTDTGDLTTGAYGGSGDEDADQTDTDPTVTGLEYPVQILGTADYYKAILQPATFPEAGTIRLTAVFGYNDITYPSGPSSVPISEVGMFTESVPGQDIPPLDSTIEVTPPVPAKPPLGVRYMVAYNTFDTISKTTSFVLQVDWELRFA